MSFTEKEKDSIQLAWQGFLLKRRPPVEIRSQLDFSLTIEGQSVFVNEVRPRWDLPEVSLEHPVAKTIFVRSSNHWKIYWMRGNLKWYPYDPKPIVHSFEEFLKEVDDDPYAAFWG